MCKDGGGGRKRESKGSEEGQDRGFPISEYQYHARSESFLLQDRHLKHGSHVL